MVLTRSTEDETRITAGTRSHWMEVQIKTDVSPEEGDVAKTSNWSLISS
jgi:hypothetical protein